MMKIAVFLPNWIGDVAMATPAFRALRQHYAQAQLIGVLRSYVQDVVQGAPWFDKLVFLDRTGPWSRRWPAVAWQLRRDKVDLAILFPNSFHAALVAKIGGCQRRIGYRRYARGWLLTDALEPLREPHGRITPSPIIDAYNLLAEFVGCPNPGYHMELFTTAADELAADVVWQHYRLGEYPEVIGLNPGAAFGAAKCWPAESFAQLAQDLSDQRGSAVLVLCGPAERDLTHHIVKLAARKTVFSLADQPLSLGLTKACVRRLDLLVTTDSGPRHFAAAFNRPVVTLFGPTHIAWTETYFPRAVHLQKKVDCGPCQLRRCPLDHRCLTSLAPAEVYTAVNELLARFPGLPAFQRKAS